MHTGCKLFDTVWPQRTSDCKQLFTARLTGHGRSPIRQDELFCSAEIKTPKNPEAQKPEAQKPRNPQARKPRTNRDGSGIHAPTSHAPHLRRHANTATPHKAPRPACSCSFARLPPATCHKHGADRTVGTSCVYDTAACMLLTAPLLLLLLFLCSCVLVLGNGSDDATGFAQARQFGAQEGKEAFFNGTEFTCRGK